MARLLKSSPGIFKALLFYFTVGWPEWKLAVIVAGVTIFCAVPLSLKILHKMEIINYQSVGIYSFLFMAAVSLFVLLIIIFRPMLK